MSTTTMVEVFSRVAEESRSPFGVNVKEDDHGVPYYESSNGVISVYSWPIRTSFGDLSHKPNLKACIEHAKETMSFHEKTVDMGFPHHLFSGHKNQSVVVFDGKGWGT